MFDIRQFQPVQRVPLDITSKVLIAPFPLAGRGYCLQLKADPSEFHCGDILVYEGKQYRIASTEEFWAGQTPDSRSDVVNLIVQRVMN